MAINCTFSISSEWTLCGQVNDGGPVKKIPIHTTPFQVGRQAGLPLSVQCPTVSNVHAEIMMDQGQLAVRDLRSTNGTFVNGKRIATKMTVCEGDILQLASLVFRISRQDSGPGTATLAGDDCERAMALIRFDRLISDRAVVPFFQPIIRPTDHSRIGYEVLGRSQVYGLQTPQTMFHAATQLNLEIELSRLFRRVGLDTAEPLSDDTNVFVNSHPSEMNDLDGLVSSLEEVRQLHPSRHITLEIHEATITDPSVMSRLRAMLNELNIGLAYDDFGAGQSRLLELIEVPPDYLKFDITMIKNIDTGSPARCHMLHTLVMMVRDLGIQPLAEGIETKGEADRCIDLGFELAQGFYFGRPAPIDATQPT